MKPERAWERASREGARVFYEEATETIRVWPENYCLAARSGEHSTSAWVPFIDAAIPEPNRTYIEKRIQEYGHRLSPQEMVEQLEGVVPEDLRAIKLAAMRARKEG